MVKYYNRANKYFSKNPDFNGLVHIVAGIGIGFLLTYPLAAEHPVRWGVTFLILALIGHIWAATHS